MSIVDGETTQYVLLPLVMRHQRPGGEGEGGGRRGGGGGEGEGGGGEGEGGGRGGGRGEVGERGILTVVANE